jgi:hypothetical protein
MVLSFSWSGAAMQLATLLRAGSACLSLLALGLPAAGQPIGLPVPEATNIIPERVVMSDVVVVGKVTAVEEKRVVAPGYGKLGGQKVGYKIAQVKVTELLRGPKDLDQIRLGFLPDPDLEAGHEACFLLTKHPDERFFVPATHPLYGCPPKSVFIDKGSPDSKDQLALVKRCVKLLQDPVAGLQAKDIEDRFLTATMLVIRYKRPLGAGPQVKKEAIDAKESKLILEALRDADWTKKYPDTWLAPVLAFNHLGPSSYNPAQKGADPRQWLKDNAGTYRMERFVLETPAQVEKHKK